MRTMRTRCGVTRRPTSATTYSAPTWPRVTCDRRDHRRYPGVPVTWRTRARTPVYDIVTRLEQTQLLAAAAARGCVPHPGLPMLAGQVDLILDFLGLGGTGQFHDRERFLVCPD